MRSFIGGILTCIVAVLVISGARFGFGQDCPRPRLGKCADIPPGAIPQPLGTFACQWQTAQIGRAQQDLFVIYENEWYLGGNQLGPYGQRHMAQIASNIERTPLKVVIQPSFDSKRNAPDESLNQTRLDLVVKQLTKQGVSDAKDRVVLAWPKAEGMYGDEAVRVGAQRLQGGQSTQSGTASPTGGQFGGTGSPSPPPVSLGGGIGSGGY